MKILDQTTADELQAFLEGRRRIRRAGKALAREALRAQG